MPQHRKVRKDQVVTVHHASTQKGQKRKPLTPEENSTFFSEHATSLCKSYSDAFHKLQAEFRSQSLRGVCFLCCCQLVHLEHIAKTQRACLKMFLSGANQWNSLILRYAYYWVNCSGCTVRECTLVGFTYLVFTWMSDESKGRIYRKRMYLWWGLWQAPWFT